jgi:hypothetical protein
MSDIIQKIEQSSTQDHIKDQTIKYLKEAEKIQASFERTY